MSSRISYHLGPFDVLLASFFRGLNIFTHSIHYFTSGSWYLHDPFHRWTISSFYLLCSSGASFLFRSSEVGPQHSYHQIFTIVSFSSLSSDFYPSSSLNWAPNQSLAHLKSAGRWGPNRFAFALGVRSIPWDRPLCSRQLSFCEWTWCNIESLCCSEIYFLPGTLVIGVAGST